MGRDLKQTKGNSDKMIKRLTLHHHSSLFSKNLVTRMRSVPFGRGKEQGTLIGSLFCESFLDELVDRRKKKDIELTLIIQKATTGGHFGLLAPIEGAALKRLKTLSKMMSQEPQSLGLNPIGFRFTRLQRRHFAPNERMIDFSFIFK